MGVKNIILKVEKKSGGKNKKWVEKKNRGKKNWEKVGVKKNVIKKFKKSGGKIKKNHQKS